MTSILKEIDEEMAGIDFPNGRERMLIIAAERIRELEAALRPFIKAATLFEDIRHEDNHWIGAGLKVGDLRAAVRTKTADKDEA